MGNQNKKLTTGFGEEWPRPKNAKCDTDKTKLLEIEMWNIHRQPRAKHTCDDFPNPPGKRSCAFRRDAGGRERDRSRVGGFRPVGTIHISMGWMGYKGEGDVTYLLLHLADLEFVRAQLSIILALVTVAVLLLDNVLHLPYKGTTCGTDSLAGCF